MSDNRAQLPAIARLLAGVRRGIRAYVWAEGLAAAALLLGFAFWASLGFDWMLEPPGWLRAALLVVAGGALLWILQRLILRRAFVHLADRNMALLVERRYPNFDESLITTVELASASRPSEPFDREMLSSTQRAALEGVEQVQLARVFNTRKLYRRLALAVLLLASVVGFGALASDAFGVWARRSFLLSNELWPRSTHLSVDGFAGGRIKVALGSDYDLVVKADAARDRVVPENVDVLLRDGSSRRESMSREGTAVRGLDSAQKYTYSFKSILSSIDFYVIGGDDRIGPLRIEAVESPTIGRMTLECRYPAYTHKAADEHRATGEARLPMGTEVTIRGETNKDLVRVQIDEPADHGAPVTHTIEVAADNDASHSPRDFRFEIPRLEGDKTLLFTLWDTDGVRSREPIRLTLKALADEPPQVDAQLLGVGRSITPQARLPISGSVTDDYGVAKAWFEYQVDENPSATRSITLADAGQIETKLNAALLATELNLAPKQKLTFAVRAADGCALGEKPNEGTSQRYVLDVVTPEQLIAQLEQRELALRRRFETIVEELTDTRNLISSVTAEPEKAEAAPADEKPAKQISPEEMLDRSRARAERTQQNVQRTAQETLDLAIAFETIHAELVNNDIRAEDRKERLKEGIALPLRAISARMDGELAQRLKKLASSLADPAAARDSQQAAVAEADQVLVEMQQVLSKMLQVETLNEIVDLLRDIIDTQNQVNKRTKAVQKKQLLESP